MAYLLVIAAAPVGSRGSRFYRNTLGPTGAVDNHSSDRGKAETMQDIGIRPAKPYEEQDTSIPYDLPSDMALRRQNCEDEHVYLRGNKMYFECKSGCCCQGRQKKIKVTYEKYVCERCTSQCQSG